MHTALKTTVGSERRAAAGQPFAAAPSKETHRPRPPKERMAFANKWTIQSIWKSFSFLFSPTFLFSALFLFLFWGPNQWRVPARTSKGARRPILKGLKASSHQSISRPLGWNGLSDYHPARLWQNLVPSSFSSQKPWCCCLGLTRCYYLLLISLYRSVFLWAFLSLFLCVSFLDTLSAFNVTFSVLLVSLVIDRCKTGHKGASHRHDISYSDCHCTLNRTHQYSVTRV